eukprot:747873-Hanusia_phi.AAC.4
MKRWQEDGEMAGGRSGGERETPDMMSREPDWPITKPDAPYQNVKIDEQVKLEDGTLIYVPFDEDDFIRSRGG